MEMIVRFLCLLPLLIALIVILPDITLEQCLFINVALAISLSLYEVFVLKSGTRGRYSVGARAQQRRSVTPPLAGGKEIDADAHKTVK